VRSTAGAGTTFSVTVPARDREGINGRDDDQHGD
jgi:hypothetical protein